MNYKQVALDYVAMHRDNNIDEWQPLDVFGWEIVANGMAI